MVDKVTLRQDFFECTSTFPSPNHFSGSLYGSLVRGSDRRPFLTHSKWNMFHPTNWKVISSSGYFLEEVIADKLLKKYPGFYEI
jgi:hypothetical protein